MKIVADQGNREYYLHAAKVCIEEILNGVDVQGNSIRAIRLLVLAEVYRRK